MRELALTAAGVVTIAAALIHGWLGETRVVGPAKFPNRMVKDMARAIWQLSTALWILGGAVLIWLAQPGSLPPSHRPFVVGVAMFPVLWCVVGNAWASRGRHFGWMILGLALALAAYGVWGPA